VNARRCARGKSIYAPARRVIVVEPERFLLDRDLCQNVEVSRNAQPLYWSPGFAVELAPDDDGEVDHGHQREQGGDEGETTGASAIQRATAPAEQTDSPNMASTIRRVSALRAGAAPPMPGERVVVALFPLAVSHVEPRSVAPTEPASVLDDEHSFARAQGADYIGGQAEHGCLVGWAVADDERAATCRHRVEHAAKRATEQ